MGYGSLTDPAEMQQQEQSWLELASIIFGWPVPIAMKPDNVPKLGHAWLPCEHKSAEVTVKQLGRSKGA
jgi:hypothetical protein